MKFSKIIYLQDVLLVVLILICLFINLVNIDSNLFVNNNVIFFSNLLCLETAIIIIVSKIKNNVLLLLLGLNSILFYILRILTLATFIPNDYVLVNKLSAEDYENALKVILAFLPIISFYLYFFENKTLKLFGSNKYISFVKKNPDDKNLRNKIMFVLGILWFGIVLSLSVAILKNSFIVAFATYASLIIQKDLILFCALIFFFTYNKLLSKKEKVIFIVTFLIYIISDTLIGNKSSMYKFVFFYLYAFLATNSLLIIKLRYIFIVIIIGLSGIYLYLVGNVIRDQIYRGGSGISSIYTVVTEINPDYLTEFGDYAAAHISGRIGFLDYTAKLIKDAPLYYKVFNLKYYFGSIVDYTLPGTNPFNYLRVSNTINSIDVHGRLLTQSEYAESDYTSDCITVYGEFFLLGRGFVGGFLLLSIFFLSILFFFNKWMLKSKTLIKRNMIKGVEIFCIFELVINGFGLDWAVVTFLFYIIYLSIFLRYYE